MEQHKRLPEWSIFDRIEELETLWAVSDDKSKSIEEKLELLRDLMYVALTWALDAQALTTDSKEQRRMAASYLMAWKRAMKKAAVSSGLAEYLEAFIDQRFEIYKDVYYSD
jgi:hypothetical protein